MLYDVNKIADLTNVSKVTIYNKLKLKQLKPFIVKKQGKTYVSEDGFNLIKNALNLNDSLKVHLNPKETEHAVNAEISVDSTQLINLKDDLIKSLKSEVEFLRNEITVKNNQLDKKDKLIENMQILLKQEQDHKLLEEHFKELDTKLIDLRKDLIDKQDKSKFNIFKRAKNKLNTNE